MRHRVSEQEPSEPSVALYWDFENLHASLCEARQEGSYSKQDNRFKVQEPLVDIAAVMALAASLGPMAINRAYGNWQYFGRYRDALLQGAVELIQLFPPGGSAKNGADIRLCLDAMEDIGRFGHIGTHSPIGTGPGAATPFTITRAWQPMPPCPSRPMRRQSSTPDHEARGHGSFQAVSAPP